MPKFIGKLTPLGNMNFGRAIDISGSRAIVGHGSFYHAVNAATRPVIIYQRNVASARWDEARRLTANDRRFFGASVAIDGDTAVVGAPWVFNDEDAVPSTPVGRVYIFSRNLGGTNNWGLQRVIDGTWGSFGLAVALSGDTLAVGEPVYMPSDTICIFRRDSGGPGGWGQVRAIPRPDTGLDAGGLPRVGDFGTRFDLSGDTLVHAALEGPEGARVFVFLRSMGGSDNWGLAQSLTSAEPMRVIGGAVAIDGDRLVTSARAFSAPTVAAAGGVDVYERTGGSAMPFNLSFSETPAGPSLQSVTFGMRVAITGDVFVSEFASEPSVGRLRAQAAIYHRSALSWELTRTVTGGILDESAGGSFTERALSEGALSFSAPRRFDFGLDLALDGTALMLGAASPASGLDSRTGLVTPFERHAGGTNNWGAYPGLMPAMAGSSSFGRAIAMNGNFAVVGEPSEAEGGPNRGAAYLFFRQSDPQNFAGEAWRLAAKLKPEVPQDEADFGRAVGVSESGIVVVGAPGEGNGAAYVFQNLPDPDPLINGYRQVIRLSFPGSPGDDFGTSVAISGSRIAVGAPGSDRNASNAGVVLIFEENLGGLHNWGWRREVFMADPDGNETNDGLGTAVALEGDTLVATSLSDEGNGSGYVFSRNQGGTDNWGQLRELRPSNTTRGFFGVSAALAGEEIVIGVFPFGLFVIGEGDAFAFARNQGGTNNWGEVKKFAPGIEDGDNFGNGVAIGDRFAVVGSPGDDGPANSAPNAGAVYLFDRDSGGVRAWGMIVKYQAPAFAAEDDFGWGVAAWQDRFAVTAQDEDSAGENAGAVYFYRMGSFERWAGTHPLGSLNNPRDDPDRDQQSNLIEFALGSNPLAAASRGEISFDIVGSGESRRLRGRVVKPTYDIKGLRYEWEADDRLTRFFSSDVTVTIDSAELLVGEVRRTFAEWPHGFIRLRVQYPE
ncbi:MAG: FG-GAP repeat protein [Verrucomicrobiales bacterium]